MAVSHLLWESRACHSSHARELRLLFNGPYSIAALASKPAAALGYNLRRARRPMQVGGGVGSGFLAPSERRLWLSLTFVLTSPSTPAPSPEHPPTFPSPHSLLSPPTLSFTQPACGPVLSAPLDVTLARRNTQTTAKLANRSELHPPRSRSCVLPASTPSCHNYLNQQLCLAAPLRTRLLVTSTSHTRMRWRDGED